ncbi:MAG TPA: Gfo/Idh/MocA family oxidoreductase [Thermoleophilaceae bacterium]
MTRAPGQRISVACFGAGWVTTHRHIPTMRRHGGFDIACIADRRGERAQAAAAELDLPRHEEAQGVDELSVRDSIDAVTCGTAPFAHERVIRSALEAGKHVLTEKPFTMTVQEGEELTALARERGLVLAIVHNFQFARSVLQLRRWIAAGRLGRVRAVWATQLSNPARRLPTWFDELPGGLFYDESPHLIYTARALAGANLDPVSVTIHPSTSGLVNTPAQIDAQMRAGDVPVSIQMNFEAPVSEWHVAVLGERGMGVVDLFRDIALFTPNDRDHKALDVLRTSGSASWHHWLGYLRSGPGHVLGKLRYGNDEVFRRFHAAIGSGKPPEGISADDALAVLRVQHWILEARGRILI